MRHYEVPRQTLDPNRLWNALQVANLPALLMVIYQLTGEQRWLEPPFRPTRSKGMDDNDSGGFTPEIQDEIRRAGHRAVMDWSDGAPIAQPQPRGELLLKLLRTCVGEEIPVEYEAMMAEEMGFRDSERPSIPEHLDEFGPAIIIGAGVGGLTAAYRLLEAGIDCLILEKNQDLGGTWLENRYPGSGVDTPSFLYSWNFYPRLWSTYFGKRAEVHEYIKSMAKSFNLVNQIQFGVSVTSAIYDDEFQCWRIECTEDGGRTKSYEAPILITAVGQLNRPQVPEIEGQHQFDGPQFHSARWPDGLEVDDQRVAIVGTGASAMQIVPAIADRVKRLDVYQRSPQWVAPAEKYFAQVPEDVHWLMANVPLYYEWYRFKQVWMFNDRTHASLQIDPEWPHQDRSINSTNEAHRKVLTRYLMEELEGREDLQQKSLPSYPPFGKRMLLDNGWYKALRKENVHLITDGISRLARSGVVSESGVERPADVVVYATGFEARRLLYPMEIRGRQGYSIREAWGDEDAEAYLGVASPGFPNLFFLYGPNTNLGHGGSYVHIVESQVRYIVDLLVKMATAGVGAVEVRSDVCDEYNREVDAAHSRMIWTHEGMDTWYRNASGRVVTNSPWRVVDYWTRTLEANLDDYVLEPVKEYVRMSGST